MAWGKESYDEIRNINLNLKSIENLFGEILFRVSRNDELKFWQDAMIAVAAAIISNDGANSTLRPDWVSEASAMIADAMNEKRKEKINETSADSIPGGEAGNEKPI